MRDDDDLLCSLDASIAALATDSGAPASFVAKIRALFEGKGISLERQAGPYLGALREAFRREESLRRVSQRSQVVLERARDDLGRLDSQWERQLGQLRELQRSLRLQSRRLRDGVQTLQPPERTVMCPGSVELPFVPGPDAVQ
jgi:hypothetical protein